MADYNFSELESLWILEKGPAQYAAVAASVALAESSGHSDALSPAGARGLWQIIRSSWPASVPYDPFDPARNAQAAIIMSSNGTNWRQWDVAWKGCCRGYVPGPRGTCTTVYDPARYPYEPFGDSCSGRIYQQNGGAQATAAGEGSAATGNVGQLPATHAGWKTLQQALAVTIPTDLRRAQRIRHYALQKLGAPRSLRG